MKAQKARPGNRATRRSRMILLAAPFFAAFLWTGEASARPEDLGSGERRSSRSGTYQAPVERSPEVLCGCTEVLKNFA